MTIGELKERIRDIDERKPVIAILDGDTIHLEDVYIWDETSANPADSPVELIF